MSGTSEKQARIRTDFAALLTGDARPVGNIATRDVANNLNHYQDSFGQVRMAFAARTDVTGYLASASINQWVLLDATGEFSLAMREDGRSYRVRVEIGGCLESASGSGMLAVVLAPLASARDLLQSVVSADGVTGARTDAVWVSDPITTTTIAYRVGASQGPNAWDRQVALTAAEAARYVTPVSGFADIGGALIAGPQCRVNLSVWGTTTVAGNDVRCHAAVLTEWVG